MNVLADSTLEQFLTFLGCWRCPQLHWEDLEILRSE